MIFTAVFLEVPEGGFSAYIEEIPGANSQGETLEEAKINLSEALRMVLDCSPSSGSEEIHGSEYLQGSQH